MVSCGFCENAASNSVGTLLVDWVAKPIKRQLDYVCRFHENVEKFRRNKEDLERARTRLQHVSDSQIQSEADKILNHVESMERRIEEDKRCFIWCPNWWWRYLLSKKLEKKTVPDISNLLQKIAHHRIPTIEFLSSSKDFMDSKSSKAAFTQILEALKDHNVSMIALWGMGGVGKTTLVREVGNLAKKLDLFDKVVITTVSKKPHFESIQDEIAKDLGFNMKNEQGRRSKQELWARLLEEKRILIILDDVWAEINLKEDVGIPFGEDHKGCKIILTTRLLHVCLAMNCQKQIPLGCLEEIEARALFERKAGLENTNDAIKKVAKEIIKKCHGLPISIVTLGTALKGKTLPLWKATLQRLKANRLMEIEDVVERNAYLCLEESFNYLKDMKTKKCFLLCSMFPEDYEIYMDDLVRYAWGLDLYKDVMVNSIEDVRNQVHAAMDTLKNSSLLLDCGDSHVKMHDTVREVALWISSDKKDIAFEIKFGVVETWPKNECFDSCTAISFMASEFAELPDGLVCPKLRILLLGGYDSIPMTITSSFFGGMKLLQVCFLDNILISPDAFQFQTNLQTLHLESCSLPDISLLGKLKELQVLSITWSDIEELPDEIGDLNNLRLLELSDCLALQRIPPHLIQRLSELEELYLDGCEDLRWATEDTTEGGGCASLSELNSLSKLKVLSLWVVPDQIPKDFVFPKLERFSIRVNVDVKNDENCQISKSLNINASELDAFQQLIGDAKTLYLEDLVGCQNLVGGLELDQELFGELTDLDLESCKDMKCLTDTSSESQALTIAFPNLVRLSMRNMSGFKEFCHGPQPKGFLKNLKTLCIWNCNDIISPIPILQDLEEVQVDGCDELQVLFQGDERISKESNLRSIQGSRHAISHHINLQSLKVVKIANCDKLRYLFPTSAADSLGQLEKLDIWNCMELEEIIQKPAGPSHHVNLQSLKVVKINNCDKLRCLFPTPAANSLGQLETLDIWNCMELEEIIQKPAGPSHPVNLQSLKVVKINNCDKLRCLFPTSAANSLGQLETLDIRKCMGLEEIIQKPERLSHHVNLQSLKVVEIAYCDKLRCLFPTSAANSLGQLEIVDIQNCMGLEEIIQKPEGPSHHVNLQSLKVVKIANCDKLRYLFPTSAANSLGQLETLDIQNCMGLEEIIQKSEGPSHPVNLQSLKVVIIVNCDKLRYLFPTSAANSLGQLETLDIRNCMGLEEIIQKTEASNVSLQSLRQVHVIGCNNLTSLYSLSHGQVLENLTTLEIHNCSGLEYTFPFSMAEGLPKLKVVKLKNLPQLKGRDGNEIVLTLPSLLQDLEVTNCPQLWTFNFTTSSKIRHSEELFDGGGYNLSSLTVFECKRVRYLFSAKIAANLPQLSRLQTIDCEELEQIIGKDETSSQDHHHLQPICFPNLTHIEIRRCVNLKSLFSVSTVAGGLPKLECLVVENISKLEQLFEEGDDAGNFSMADEDKVIKLPRLNRLILKKLPKVVRFSPVGYHFIFPSLEELEVRDCPNITTCFNVDLKPCGHAKTEATQSFDENIMEESVVAQENTWPIGSDIWWTILHFLLKTQTGHASGVDLQENLMDINYWRPPPPTGEPTMDTVDWRTQLQPDFRLRIFHKIMDTVKKHRPSSSREGLIELVKIAKRFEEKIFIAASSKSDYLRRISLKMLTMETKLSPNTMPNSTS